MNLPQGIAAPVAVLCFFFLSLVGAAAQTRSPAEVYDQPVTLPPEPVGLPTDTSRLVTTLGDAAGNTLYVVEYSNSATGENPYDLWLMVSPRGAVLAREFFFNSGSGVIVKIISFSAKRIVAQVDDRVNGVVLRVFKPQGGDFEPADFLLADAIENAEATETLVYSEQKPPRRFVDALVMRSNKVFQIKRYNVNKLRPLPED